MSNKEDVFDIIQTHPEGLDDDDISEMTGIKPRQQIQQLCNQLASTHRIRRESVDKAGKRRKIHNFPTLAMSDGKNWKHRLAALVAATGQTEDELLGEAIQMLALKVLKGE